MNWYKVIKIDFGSEQKQSNSPNISIEIPVTTMVEIVNQTKTRIHFFKKVTQLRQGDVILPISELDEHNFQSTIEKIDLLPFTVD